MHCIDLSSYTPVLLTCTCAGSDRVWSASCAIRVSGAEARWTNQTGHSTWQNPQLPVRHDRRQGKSHLTTNFIKYYLFICNNYLVSFYHFSDAAAFFGWSLCSFCLSEIGIIKRVPHVFCFNSPAWHLTVVQFALWTSNSSNINCHWLSSH